MNRSITSNEHQVASQRQGNLIIYMIRFTREEEKREHPKTKAHHDIIAHQTVTLPFVI